MGPKIEIKSVKANVARATAIDRLKQMLEIAKKCRTDASLKINFRSRYEKLDSYYEDFGVANQQCIEFIDKPENTDEFRNTALEVDDIYFEIQSIYSELFGKPTHTENSSLNEQSNSNKQNLRLPKIDLRTFDGNPRNWPSYFDMFRSLIHENSQLSATEKMHYLASTLEKEPYSLIKQLPIDGSNYQISYDLLVERYQNKRLLATTYLNDILSYPVITHESAQSLRSMIDLFSENLSALKCLEFDTDSWDFVIFNIMLQKLDISTRTQFEKKYSSVVIPSYENLISFLKEHTKALESVRCFSLEKSKPPFVKNSFRPLTNSRATFVASEQNQNIAEHCALCKFKHSLISCTKFHNKSPKDRYYFVKNNNLCINCLKPSHSLKNCPNTYRCKKCQGLHHTLLHFDNNSQHSYNSQGHSSYSPNSSQNSSLNPNRNNASQNSQQSSSQIQTNHSNDHSENVNLSSENSNNVTLTSTLNRNTSSLCLLSTVVVNISDSLGNFQKVRCLLDPASMASFITENCCVRLGLRRFNSSTKITGINHSSPVTPRGTVKCSITPVNLPNNILKFDALVLPTITSEMPSVPFSTDQWSYLSNVNLADPDFNIPGPIDVLLGVEIYSQIIKSGRISGNAGAPTAMETEFGWVLLGKLDLIAPEIRSFFISSEDNLDLAVSKFWELEDIPSIENQPLDDVKCEDIFRSTYSRDQSGRFTVSLPFKENNYTFSGSRDIALRRLHSLECRLDKNSEIRESYNSFLQEFLEKGYMSEVTPVINDDSKVYYIPHSFVYRPDAVSTKLRVVFDASAKDANNLSLNDCLFVGSNLIKDIVKLLFDFRVHRFVFTADIRKMYLQINISPEHRDVQRILFRFNRNEPVKDYRLNTVTFGVNASPWLALRTMAQLAEDGKIDFPLASKILTNNIYMDDICGGFSSIEEALDAQSELIKLLNSAGFQLHKWSSNSEILLKNTTDNSNKSYSFDKDTIVKILGMQLDTNSDCFFYKISKFNDVCTKRSILSDLARLFDPLGFLAPVIFIAKHLVQHLWTLGVQWDDRPPDEILSKWEKFKSEIAVLTDIKIPRFLAITNSDYLEIHGFGDASLKGYCACVYFRSVGKDGEVNIKLIAAKTKLAPLKTISLARLELCAALLLSKLVIHVQNCFKNSYTFHNIYCWSDSSIALSWIKSPPYKYKTFVANRITMIQERVAPEHWRHVPSKDNPADLGSRGLFPSEFLNCEQWFSGPEFLTLSIESWPNSKFSTEIDSEEIKKICFVAKIKIDSFTQLIENHSSLTKIVHIVFYIRAFIHNCRSLENKMKFCNQLEFHKSLLVLVRHVQIECFADEISLIENNQSCSKQFRKLCPFIDDNGLLRVGGRLANSGLKFESKHPVLLPKNHRLTKLIIEYYHKIYLHPGIQALHCIIVQNFWIVGAKHAIRSSLSKCIACFKVKPKIVEPLMGNLPHFRVNQVKAFQVVGVDFAGPFSISLGKCRGSKTFKAYICIFVCAAIKAIHLELVSDMTSEAFLAALRRFVSRRGTVTCIFSDCGKNFVGANNQLLKFMENAAHVEKIDWRFNIPGSSHAGGLFEAGVKSVKSHLYRVVGEQRMTYEEFYTLLVQIEAILNSRPLCSISTDPNDLSVLTPCHFLNLAPISSIPDEDLSNLKINTLSRWQLVQRMQQSFWKRWHSEYLHTLQQRLKWNQSKKNLTLDQVVLIKDENLPPMKWSLGKIVELFKGADNIVRFAKIRTAQGYLKRPIVKLCPLPVEK